jgi:hypothetical protein
MRTLALFVVLLTVAACHAKLSGSLNVDGADFKITECRNGAAFNFSGIVLGDSSGTKLRLLANIDGTVNVAMFAAGAAKGDVLPNCGTLQMSTQSSRINNISNVKGTANLSCDALGHKISGKISFENCH